MRLIDADQFEVISLKNTSLEFDTGVLYALNMLDKAPTVDAVVVVRCKDCKYFSKDRDGRDVCSLQLLTMRGTDFCSYGERNSDYD